MVSLTNLAREVHMRWILVLVVLAASPLFADKITTVEGNVFEGIVTAFDKDKQLTLATGHGDLAFTVATDIKDAEATDYTWPKSAQTAKPARAEKFEAWLKERAAQKSTAWVAIPAELEADEVEASKVIDALKAVQGSGEKSVKERKAIRKTLTDLTENKWFYIQFRVTMVEEDGGTLKLSMDNELFDARKGTRFGLSFSSGIRVSATEDLSAAEVDSKNAETLKSNEEARARGESATLDVVVDYEVAEGLTSSDGLVFRATLTLTESGEEVWVFKPVRLHAGAKPDK
jgi:hypothetical protein